MLDAAFIRANVEAVKANCRNRNVQADVDRVVGLEADRKRLLQQQQQIQQRQNELSKLIPKEKDAAKKQELIAEGKSLREQVGGFEKQVKQVEEDLHAVLLTIPNMTHPDAPVGTTAEDNKVIHQSGEPRTFDFPPQGPRRPGREPWTWSISRPAPPSPGRSSISSRTRPCCWSWPWCSTPCRRCSSMATRRSSRPTWPASKCWRASASFRAPGPGETQIYSIDDTDLCLIATAEITLGGMHRDKIFDELDLPLKYVGLSHCFRTEAGAPGRDTRGLYRVHQFTKVEMFAFTLPDQSEAMHQELLGIEKAVFDGLGLPYHVVDTCTGDLGGPAYRKYDLEAWMPGRGTKGEYGEVTSTSNCTDYQARRLNIRYKSAGRKGHALRPHAQRHGRRRQPGHARHPGELPAGRRLRGGARGPAAVGGQGAAFCRGIRRRDMEGEH